MSTDLEPVAQLVNPVTGEALTVAAPTEDLARLIADVREAEFQLRELKRVATREVLSRMDKHAVWTLRTGDLTIVGQSPTPTEEWDGPELRERLLELVDTGVLSIEAVDNAVNTVVTYKPRKAGIAALRKLGGDVAAVVDGLVREEEKERYVKVTRK